MSLHRSLVLRRFVQLGLAAAAVICLTLTLAPAQQPRNEGDDIVSPSSAAPREANAPDSKAAREAGDPPTGAARQAETQADESRVAGHAENPVDYWSMLFVFALSTLIGLGVIGRVSRLLHTPLMSLTNAISAIAVVGAIIVCGSDYPGPIRFLGGVALFASMTNIVSGFLITDRMLKMFKTPNKSPASTKAAV